MTGPHPALTEIRSTIAAAAATGRKLRIVGRGGWLDAGRPVTSDTTITVGSYSGIVDYVPGDLTLTARAGTSLREVAEVTAPHEQWLPLDPYGSPEGSVGATVATGSYGPLCNAFGRPRDQVLQLEFVAGTGEVITVGSRMVKNVAGFDLTRLLVGSWGTLGVITQATFRLRAKSEIERTIVLPAPQTRKKLEAFLSEVRAAPLAALAVEMVDSEAATAIGLPAWTQLVARIGGNVDAVAAQARTLAEFGDAADAPADLWTRLRAIDDHASDTIRYAVRLTDVAALWDALEKIEGAMIHATPNRGIVRCVFPRGAGSTSDEQTQILSSPIPGARAIVERVGPRLAQAVASSAIGDRISQRLKLAFDPDNILNAGILGPFND